MDADEFAKAVRGGNEKYRADDLVVDTGKETLTGKGYLLIRPKELVILMTLDVQENPFAHGSPRVVTTSDYWTMTGTIDLSLRFRCKCGPVPTQHCRNGVWSLEESVSPIELEVRGWDRFTTQERKEKWKEIHAALGKSDPYEGFDAAEAERLADGSFEFHANFVDHKLRFADEVTHTERKNPFFGNDGSGWKTDTLMGETSTYKFGLVQACENDDLRAGHPLKREPASLERSGASAEIPFVLCRSCLRAWNQCLALPAPVLARGEPDLRPFLASGSRPTDALHAVRWFGSRNKDGRDSRQDRGVP